MKTKKASNHRYCESCGTPRYEERDGKDVQVEKFYEVAGLWVCLDCGNDQIDTWNKLVQEGDMAFGT